MRDFFLTWESRVPNCGSAVPFAPSLNLLKVEYNVMRVLWDRNLCGILHVAAVHRELPLLQLFKMLEKENQM